MNTKLGFITVAILFYLENQKVVALADSNGRGLCRSNNRIQIALRKILNVVLPTNLNMDSPGVYEYVPFEPLISYRWNGLFFEFQKPYDNDFWRARIISRQRDFDYLYTNVIDAIEYDRKIARMARAIGTSSIERSKVLMEDLNTSLDVMTRFKVYSRIWDSHMHYAKAQNEHTEVTPLLKVVRQNMLECEELLGDEEPATEYGPDGSSDSDEYMDAQTGESSNEESVQVDTFRFTVDREQMAAAINSRAAVQASSTNLSSVTNGSQTFPGDKLLFDADVIDDLVKGSEIVETEDAIIIRKYMDEDEMAAFSHKIRSDDSESGSSTARMSIANLDSESQHQNDVQSHLTEREAWVAALQRGRAQLSQVSEPLVNTDKSSAAMTHSKHTGTSDAIYYRICAQFDTLVSMLLHPVNSYKLLCYILSRSVLVERADQEAYGGGIAAHLKGFVTIILPFFVLMSSFEQVCVKPLIGVLLKRQQLARRLQIAAVLTWLLREVHVLFCSPLMGMVIDAMSFFSLMFDRRSKGGKH